MLKMPRRRRLPPGFWPAPIRPPRSLLFPFLGLSVAAALLAALVMPQQLPFPYTFETGKTWTFPTLKAPFDFEVLLPEDQVKDQLTRINALHAPYYRLDPERARQQKRHFTELIQEQVHIGQNDVRFTELNANPNAYRNYGLQLLDKIYAHGIASPDLEALLRENPKASIYLVANGSAPQRLPADTLFTLKTAQDYLTDSLPYSPLRQPELLLPFLEKALAPNVLYSDSLTIAGKRQQIAAVVSTGIMVRKGEVIIRKGERIQAEDFRKLDSLSRRFDAPKTLPAMLGYALAAFLVFAIFFLWIIAAYPAIWAQRELRLLAPVVILLVLLGVTVTTWIGYAVALLLPLWGMPVLLRRMYPSEIAWASWAAVICLSAMSLDWSAAWLMLQVTGAATFALVYPQASGGLARAVSALIVALVQTAAWAACLLSGKLPLALMVVDVALFILVANGLLAAALQFKIQTSPVQNQ